MKYAVFILTHGRAKTISTYNALRAGGYTGQIWVVIDNEDDQEDLYRDRFGDDIIQFDKRDYVKKTDLGDLDDNRKIGVLARNFIQDKAEEMGYDFHLQLDDDIHGFDYRYMKNGRLVSKTCHRMDDVLKGMCEYMEATKITSLSFSLSAYFIGGAESGEYKKQMIPKTMTTFLMRKDQKRYFHMRMNDDITTSMLNGMRGDLYYTYMPVMLSVDGTQVQNGGMTDIYRDNGTYRKSFYSVMALPSCVRVADMGISERRVHHEVRWNNCIPKLLSESWRK